MTFEQDNLCYELDKINFTAKIIRSDKAKGNIFIPHSVTYKSQKYIIKIIKEGSFANNLSIESIEFSNDSEVHTIEKGSFWISSLERLMIPSSVTNLEEGWCQNTRELTEITISPLNRRYSYVGHKIIVGKSNEFSDIYDNLIFARRDIQKVTIPSYIKSISSYAFSECYELKSIILNEGLNSIGIEAFSFTSLHNLSIPKNLNDLNEGWCRGISELKEIKISPENDHFKYIDNQMIVGKSDKKSDIFDTLYFVNRDVLQLIVPSYIKYIKPYSFSECYNIDIVTFCEDSELISIGKCSFMSSSISSFFIPEKVKVLEEGWCRNTTELSTIVISENNKKFEYIDDSFIVEKNDDCDVICFVRRNFDGIFYIPSNIKQISSFAFHTCYLLKSVESEKNSNLRLICDFSFSSSFIEYIKIPDKVYQIGKCCFYGCSKLKNVLFSDDSELVEIKRQAFAFSSFKFISIPRGMNHIYNMTFLGCEKLFGIEFLGKEIEIDYACFNQCISLSLVSFPNAHNIRIYNEFFDMKNNLIIYTDSYSNIDQFTSFR